MAITNAMQDQVLTPIVDIPANHKVTDKILLRPTKGSRGAFERASYVRAELDKDGRVIRSDVREYTKETLPLTKQGEMIFWNESKRKYEFDMSQVDLDLAVKECEFTYPEKYPAQYGNPITRCNTFDRNDAFVYQFNLQARLTKEEGEAELDMSNPRHVVLWAHLKMRPEYYSPKADDQRGPLSAVYRNMLVSTNYEDSGKYAEFKKIQKINDAFAKLDDKAKKTLCRLVGINVTANTTHETFEPKLYEYAMSKDGTKTNPNLSKQDHFVSLISMSAADLEMEVLIYLGKNKRFIKTQGNLDAQYFTLFGKPVGSSTKSIAEYLTNPDNQEILIQLQTAVSKT